MTYTLNNFHHKFSGKFYRGLKKDERSLQLFADLDRVLVSTDFDYQRFEKILERKGRYVSKGMNARDKRSRDRLDALYERNQVLLQEIVEPAYNFMVALGYSHKELTD